MKFYLKIIVLISIISVNTSCSSDSTSDNDEQLPILSTSQVVNIMSTSVDCGGNITSDGGTEISSRGIVYSTSTNPSLDDSVKTAGNGVGNFAITVDNLLPNTTYYLKSYATNNSGTAYGQQISFTTLNNNVPSVSTTLVNEITNSSANVYGKITVTNNSPVLSKGFVWSTNPNPTISDNKIEDVSNSNEFSKQLPNLTRNTTYFVRAFVTNSFGTNYGQELTFTTLDNYLMFTTNSVIYKHILHNVQDKIIYLFTYDFDYGNTSNFKLIAYDYENKTVIQERSINPFLTTVGSTLHSINSFNNQLELYIVSEHAVSILDPITLQTINTITFSSSANVATVEQKSDLLFISYSDNNPSSAGDKIAVYNRNTLNLISTTATAKNFASLSVYKDLANPNQIKCLAFPQFSNDLTFSIITYNNNGNYLPYSSLASNYGEGSILRTSDDLNFVIKGSQGRIYFKNNLDNNSTTLSSDTDLTDYKISSDGNTIYAIHRNPNYHYKIRKFNTINFVSNTFITIREESPQNLFIDNNSVIIVEYNAFTSSEKQVFLSIY